MNANRKNEYKHRVIITNGDSGTPKQKSPADRSAKKRIALAIAENL